MIPRPFMVFVLTDLYLFPDPREKPFRPDTQEQYGVQARCVWTLPGPNISCPRG